MRKLRIESPDNVRFKTWKQCLKASGIEKHGQFLVSGLKIIAEELRARPRIYTDLLIHSGLDESFFSHADLPENIQIVDLPRKLFEELNELGVPGPLLVGSRPQWPVFDPISEPQGLEVMLAMQDPLNVGAAIRTCVAFGAARIILLAECAHPLLPRALRASSGAALHAPIELGPSFSILSPEAQSKLTALDLTGEDVARFKWPRDMRVIIGEEGRGFPEAFQPAARVKINIADSLESLNAGAALAIALYSYRSA